ncbi:MAG TPA: DinB family protein [Holophagaceae bacterium]|nr:DinB family protein [Holophagaceae bacterium]
MAILISEAKAQLARTPATLQAWFGGLPEAWLGADEGPDTFSARDVLAHLIHGERADWMARTRIILEQGEGHPFEPFDRRGFLDEARSWSLADLLAEFARLRAANLAALEGLDLSPEAMAKTGMHPGLGKVTLENLLATWVVHDLGHLAQAARVMAKRYTAEVGPWVDYLPILTRR